MLPPDLRLGRRPAGRTLLTADWLIGHEDGRHVYYRRGDLVIEGRRVLYAGPRFAGEVARRIDFGPALIAPGLIDLDALSDLDTYALALDNHPGWQKGRIRPQTYIDRGPREMYTAEELAFQKRYAFATLLANGITTALPIASLYYREWADTVAEFDAAADAALELGLRVFLSPAYRAGGVAVDDAGAFHQYFDEARGLAGLAAARDFIARRKGEGGLIDGLLAPDRAETNTADLMRATFAAAGDLDVPVRLHMAQGALELQLMHRRHGCTAPEWLAGLGCLSPRLIAPHGTHASDRDIGLYADHGVTLAHSPLVSLRMGSILRSFASVKARGVNIGMATDTAPPDMWMNMMAGLSACRVAEGRPDAASSAEFFEAATLGGARALARPDLGRLQAGALADVAVFALDDPAMTPTVDPVTTLVLGASGKVTRAVFVDGRLSMWQGRVAGLDLPAARARAQAQFDGLVATYPERSWRHPPVDDLFRPAFPIR